MPDFPNQTSAEFFLLVLDILGKKDFENIMAGRGPVVLRDCANEVISGESGYIFETSMGRIFIPLERMKTFFNKRGYSQDEAVKKFQVPVSKTHTQQPTRKKAEKEKQEDSAAIRWLRGLEYGAFIDALEGGKPVIERCFGDARAIKYEKSYYPIRYKNKEVLIPYPVILKIADEFFFTMWQATYFFKVPAKSSFVAKYKLFRRAAGSVTKPGEKIKQKKIRNQLRSMGRDEFDRAIQSVRLQLSRMSHGKTHWKTGICIFALNRERTWFTFSDFMQMLHQKDYTFPEAHAFVASRHANTSEAGLRGFAESRELFGLSSTTRPRPHHQAVPAKRPA